MSSRVSPPSIRFRNSAVLACSWASERGRTEGSSALIFTMMGAIAFSSLSLRVPTILVRIVLSMRVV
jgi:hypothetical protein